MPSLQCNLFVQCPNMPLTHMLALLPLQMSRKTLGIEHVSTAGQSLLCLTLDRSCLYSSTEPTPHKLLHACTILLPFCSCPADCFWDSIFILPCLHLTLAKPWRPCTLPDCWQSPWQEDPGYLCRYNLQNSMGHAWCLKVHMRLLSWTSHSFAY